MCELVDGVMFGFLGWCAWSDWKTKEIPVYMLIIYGIEAVIFSIICSEKSLNSILGGIFLGVLFLFISKWTKEAIGYGDSWLILILGIYLGGTRLLWVLFMASFCAGVCSFLYMCTHKWKRDATLPFVPFMLIGYIGVMFL